MSIIKNIFLFTLCFLMLNIVPLSYASDLQEQDTPFEYGITWAVSGNSHVLAVQLTSLGGNYTYAPNQADLYPTTLELVLNIPESVSKNTSTDISTDDFMDNSASGSILNTSTFANTPLYFPKGKHKSDPINPSKKVYIYENTTYIFIVFSEGQAKLLFQKSHLSLSFLACSIKRCMPMQINLPIPNENTTLPANTFIWYQEFENLQQNQALNTRNTLTIASPQNPFPLGIATTTNDQNLAAFDISSLQQNLSQPQAYDFTPKTLEGTVEISFLSKALLFGLLAGFILNFMPCVLPVIALKISAFLQSDQDPHTRKKQFREHNTFFGLGIITWFMALGLLLGLADMSWGQLFQEPKLVLGLLVFIFTLGLSLFGLFSLPFFSIRIQHNQKNDSPKLSAFSAGLMATLLATPCSGPLLGAVLGYSLTQSIPVLLTIFFAMGLGMALPYIIFAINPSLIRFMPKAGAWMHTMEHLLGFALMASVIYFVSILPKAWQFKSFILLFVVAITLYIWGKWGSINATGIKKLMITSLCIITVSGTSYQLFRASNDPILWEDFNPTIFHSLLGEEMLLLKFTADWCPTCKILEHTVFTEKNIQAVQKSFNIRFIYVDITQHDKQKQNLLRSLDSVSIPLLAVFPKGTNSKYPIIIRDIYTYNQLLKAVKTAQADSN